MKLVQVLLLGLLAVTVSATCYCDTGKYLQESTFTCVDIASPDENCLVYNDEQECEVCSTGFQKTATNTCVALTNEIENCRYTETDDSNPSCQKCYDGYYKKQGQCEANPSTPENCAEYSWSSSQNTAVCDVCIEGFYENEGNCVANPTTIENCTKYSSATYCSRCASTHYKDGSTGECVELPSAFSPIDGCEKYSKNSSQTNPVCASCTDYEYDSHNDSCRSCPFVYVPEGSSGAVLSASALLLVVLALLF